MKWIRRVHHQFIISCNCITGDMAGKNILGYFYFHFRFWSSLHFAGCRTESCTGLILQTHTRLYPPCLKPHPTCFPTVSQITFCPPADRYNWYRLPTRTRSKIGQTQFLKMKVSDESVYECTRATYSKGRGGRVQLTGSERCFAEAAAWNTTYRSFMLLWEW